MAAKKAPGAAKSLSKVRRYKKTEEREGDGDRVSDTESESEDAEDAEIADAGAGDLDRGGLRKRSSARVRHGEEFG